MGKRLSQDYFLYTNKDTVLNGIHNKRKSVFQGYFHLMTRVDSGQNKRIVSSTTTYQYQKSDVLGNLNYY